jgi:hypothetical protein
MSFARLLDIVFGQLMKSVRERKKHYNMSYEVTISAIKIVDMCIDS